MAPINFAILGSGIFVREQHKPAVEASPLANLVAVYSRSRKSAEALMAGEKQQVDLYSEDSGEGKGLDDLLKRDDVQAVIIALPINVQPNIIKRCLKAGKHVLSEKPVAPDTKAADELIAWYHDNFAQGQPVWAVAENFRYMEAWWWARRKLEEFGKVTAFNVQMAGFTATDNKYYETEWRKSPEYQGGFLLDAGVHFTAGLQILLTPSDPIARIAAFTQQIQAHLPPVDTIHASLRTRSGVTGHFTASFGASTRAFDFTAAAERGSVTVSGGGKVTVRDAEGKLVEERTFEDDKTGVAQEVHAFAEALSQGKGVNELQRPELAWNDLAIVEGMLKSGDKDGEPVNVDLKG